ncbi:MAG: hypothetical protein ACK587_04180, partial [Cyanobacteriota bacterium]
MACDWLEQAGQLAEDEMFSPPRAKGRAYSSRWLRWSGENVDLAASIVLEYQASVGLDRAPEP